MLIIRNVKSAVSSPSQTSFPRCREKNSKGLRACSRFPAYSMCHRFLQVQRVKSAAKSLTKLTYNNCIFSCRFAGDSHSRNVMLITNTGCAAKYKAKLRKYAKNNFIAIFYTIAIHTKCTASHLSANSNVAIHRKSRTNSNLKQSKKWACQK